MVLTILPMLPSKISRIRSICGTRWNNFLRWKRFQSDCGDNKTHPSTDRIYTWFVIVRVDEPYTLSQKLSFTMKVGYSNVVDLQPAFLTFHVPLFAFFSDAVFSSVSFLKFDQEARNASGILKENCITCYVSERSIHRPISEEKKTRFKTSSRLICFPSICPQDSVVLWIILSFKSFHPLVAMISRQMFHRSNIDTYVICAWILIWIIIIWYSSYSYKYPGMQFSDQSAQSEDNIDHPNINCCKGYITTCSYSQSRHSLIVECLSCDNDAVWRWK